MVTSIKQVMNAAEAEARAWSLIEEINYLSTGQAKRLTNQAEQILDKALLMLFYAKIAEPK